MAMWIAAGDKSVLDDGTNGVPARLYDAIGNAIGASNPGPARLYDGSGNPVSTTAGLASPLGSANRLVQTTVQTLLATVNPGAQTAGGTSSTIFLPCHTQIVVMLFVSALSGTSPVFNCYLDVAEDSATYWFQSAQVGPANISALPSQPTTNTMPSGYVANSTTTAWYWRIRWTLTGTGPSVTFVAYVYGR